MRSKRDAHGWHADGMKTQEHLEPMRCVYDTDIKKDGDCALYVPCSQVQLARVVVCVLVLVDVICVMLVVLIARVDIRAVYVQFSYPFSVVEDVLFTPPVGDSELRWLLPK